MNPYAAKMRMPGRAWLHFEAEPDGEGSVICQTAQYDPVGLAGSAYWYALYPVRQFVFAGMLRELQARPGRNETPLRALFGETRERMR